MKIGFSTNAYTRKSLTYAIQSISDIGYDGIEIVLDIPHAFLPLSEDIFQNIHKSLEKCELKITNLNANTVAGWYGTKTDIEKFEPSLSNENEKLRKWRISYSKKAIELASKLNSPSISITSGLSKNFHKNTLKKFQNSLKELANYAEKRNIKLAIEYEPGLLIGKADDVFPLTKEFSNVGLNFDVGPNAVPVPSPETYSGYMGDFKTAISKLKEIVTGNALKLLYDSEFLSLISKEWFSSISKNCHDSPNSKIYSKS